MKCRDLLPLMLVPLAACTDIRPGSDADSEPEAWALSDEPVSSIGQTDGEAPYLLSRIRDVELLPDGRVLVADGSTETIRLFDASGLFLRQMGGNGQGPGEFSYLASLDVRGPDTIVAFDAERRLTTFLLDGSVLSTQLFDAADARPELYVGRYANGEHALAWIRQVPRDRTVVTADAMQVGRFGADGRLIDVFGTWSGMRRLGSPVPFSAHFLTAMIGDTLFLADGMDDAVHVLGPQGTTVRTLQLSLPRLNAFEAWDRLEGAIADSAQVTQLKTVLENPGTDSVPTFSDMFIDDEARLWLKTYDPATDSHRLSPTRPRTGGEWLAIDSFGQILARLAVPSGFRLIAIRDDRAVGVSRDELGVEHVSVYRIVRN